MRLSKNLSLQWRKRRCLNHHLKCVKAQTNALLDQSKLFSLSLYEWLIAAPAKEFTVMVIKPDAVKAGRVAEIIQKVCSSGRVTLT